MGQRASLNPNKAEVGGGNFGFPAGSIVTIIEAAFTTWGEAGEKAITKGRKESDPALKLVGEIEGEDEARPPVFLSAGKSERLVPSDDGEYLEIAEGSSATALTQDSNTQVFLASLCDEKHLGKGKAYDPESLDASPISESLVGLKFVAGAKTIPRSNNDGSQSANRPTLICDEIIDKPGKGKKSGSGSSSSKPSSSSSATSSSKKPGKKSNDDAELTEAAEKAVVEALDQPKWRNGIPAKRLYLAVHNMIKEEENADAIMKLVGDDEWAQHNDRPWIFDSDAATYTKP